MLPVSSHKEQTPSTAVTTNGKATGNPLQLKTVEEDDDDAVQLKQNPLRLQPELDEDELIQKKENPLQQKKSTQNPLQLKQPANNPLQLQGKETAASQTTKNDTGMPDNLKTGIESLSGYSMHDVKVHYNSDKPAQLQALAYAQGTDIHIAPGQEQHLPHEAWHVVQQKQGRVQPTIQMKGGIAVNDDKELENEADVMGSIALQMKVNNNSKINDSTGIHLPVINNNKLIQKTPIQDVNFAIQNAKHVRDQVFPGIFIDFRTVYRGIRTDIQNYSAAHGGAHPPQGHDLDSSAEGLRKFSQNLVEAADAKWAEAGEMARLIQKNYIPIPARNNANDADIEYSKNGGITGTEVKACNTHVVADVTGHINTADTQLGSRVNITRKKIVMWIAHESNRWPGVNGFNTRINNATIIADVQNQLNGMYLPFTDTITILMVRTPPGYPSVNQAVDVKATGGNGNWAANVTHVY